MNVTVTGIGPMTPCVKGAQGLGDFHLERLWARSEQPWFDPKVDIGGRGFKYLNAATRYLTAAIRQFEAVPKPGEVVADSDRKGMIIASNTCTRQEIDEFDRTLLERGCNAIDPMRAPSFCANVGAGTLSIKHQAKAFNITLVNPLTAGLEAVALAKTSIIEGRASTVIVGAMEDDSEFVLGSGYPVTTIGGAWALRLQAVDASPASGAQADRVARLGGTLNRFIPDIPGVTEAVESLAERLQQDFSPLLRGGGSLRVYVSMLTDSHSRHVHGLIERALNAHGIGTDAIVTPTQDTWLGTLLPLAHLSWCALNLDRALCIAIGPLGHISAVEVMKPDAEYD